jgi:hypothetical protein
MPETHQQAGDPTTDRQPDAGRGYERLVAGIADLAERWGDLEVADDEGGLRLQLAPAPGLRTFLSIQRQPDAVFSALHKVECSTLVGTVAAVDEELIGFLDTANAATFGGAWEVFADGDLGLTGQLLLADLSEPRLPELIGQLLALQVEDAVAVGGPPGMESLEDLYPPTRPPVQLAFHRPRLDLAEMAELLQWRSAHHGSHRWVVDSIAEDQVTLLAPTMVTEPVRRGDLTCGEAELLPDLRRVTVAHATHPRRGPGILVQVSVLPDAQQDALTYRNWGIVTQSGRWYGTGLGGLTIWTGDGSAELVYRAFLPLELLGVLNEPGAVQLAVDTVLGAVNITGVGEAIIDAIVNAANPDMVDEAIALRQREMRRRFQVAAVRAATHVRPLPDGLADMDGPLVDVGCAMLDRLALDQLQIATAPFLMSDRGFAWLPGPHVQTVTAAPMRPSRGHEVTEVSVTTELGAVSPGDLAEVRETGAGLMATLPLCSLLLTDEGQLQVISTVMVHEGVWWHRAQLVAVMAALQLNCAENVRAALDLRGIAPNPASALREHLLEQGTHHTFDSIYRVIPDLRASGAGYDLSVSDLIAITETRLLKRPFSRLFGELDQEPDVVVLLRDAHDDGGWDPPLGQAMVTLDHIDHEVAGESLKILVNPGFPPGGGDLVAEALRLTACTHDAGGVSLCPSWTVTAPTVSPTIILPKMAISTQGLDNGAEIAIQAVDSCLNALARAVTSLPNTFPGFDRSQVNLTRAEVAGCAGHPDVSTVVWGRFVNTRTVAFEQPEGDLERWLDVDLHQEEAESLCGWLTGNDNSLLFELRASDLTANRWGADFVFHLLGEDIVLDEKAAQALCDQLQHPEGPATGLVPGRIVTYPIDQWIDEEGDIVIMLPPADAIAATMGADDVVCHGIRAVTTRSLWLHFRCGVGEFDLDVSIDLAEQLLATATEDGTITMVVGFPPVDGRVATPPPATRFGEIQAAALIAALQKIGGSGE